MSALLKRALLRSHVDLGKDQAKKSDLVSDM